LKIADCSAEKMSRDPPIAAARAPPREDLPRALRVVAVSPEALWPETRSVRRCLESLQHRPSAIDPSGGHVAHGDPKSIPPLVAATELVVMPRRFEIDSSGLVAAERSGSGFFSAREARSIGGRAPACPSFRCADIVRSHAGDLGDPPDRLGRGEADLLPAGRRGALLCLPADKKGSLRPRNR